VGLRLEPRRLASDTQWTLLSIAHGVVRGVAHPAPSPRSDRSTSPRSTRPAPQLTFIFFHWNRGSPDWGDQGEHIDQTVWEQIDNGVPWTDTRKYLMVVPIVL